MYFWCSKPKSESRTFCSAKSVQIGVVDYSKPLWVIVIFMVLPATSGGRPGRHTGCPWPRPCWWSPSGSGRSPQTRTLGSGRHTWTFIGQKGLFVSLSFSVFTHTIWTKLSFADMDLFQFKSFTRKNVKGAKIKFLIRFVLEFLCLPIYRYPLQKSSLGQMLLKYGHIWTQVKQLCPKKRKSRRGGQTDPMYTCKVAGGRLDPPRVRSPRPTSLPALPSTIPRP